MLIETTAGELKKALAKVKPAIDRKSKIPILSCVLFAERFVRASNLDMEITCNFATKRFQGAAAVPFKQLDELVRHLPANEDIRLQVLKKKDDHSVHVTFSGGRYRLPGMSAEDFPEFSENKDLEQIEAPDGLCRALRACQPYICTEETRYYLNGVCFSKTSGGKGVLVATDGHRLIAHDYAHTARENLILPRTMMNAVISMGQPQKILASEKQLVFVYPGARLRTKLIEGTYPDWQRLLVSPAANWPQLRVSPRELRAALGRVTLGSARDGVHICATVSGDLVTVSHLSGEGDEGAERIENALVFHWDNVPGSVVKFKASYLAQICETHKQHDEIVLQTEGKGAPALIRSDEGDVQTLLMPMVAGDVAKARETLMTLARSSNDAQSAERAA